MIHQYLQKLGLDEKQSSIYLSLAEVGMQPASVIARRCKLDRVTCYKHLKKLVEKGLVKIYSKDGIQSFGIESFEPLQESLLIKQDDTKRLLDNFPIIQNALKEIRGEKLLVPKIQIFEGESGIRHFFRDILFEVKEQNLRQIRMLTSNTIDEQLGDVKLARFVDEFFASVRIQKLDVEILEASGTLLPERMRRIMLADFEPDKFPSLRGSTSVFLAGHSLYLVCFKDSQVGVKITQAHMSQIFHLLFDVVGSG